MEPRSNVRTDVSSSYFITGGTMRPSAPSYVERPADQELLNALLRGDFAYVLDTRQMGKSSLMARAAKALRERGASVAIVDLQKCGSTVTPAQWYSAQLSQVGEDLDLEDEIDEFWENHADLAPLNRWVRTVGTAILPKIQGQLVIFIDEIDFVRSLPFPTDEFFAAIRGFYNERAVRSDLDRLTFCLLGVAVPTDLIRSQELTPFNLGRRIDLTDFSESDAQRFSAGMTQSPEIARRLLSRVWHWTEGQPYLTQKLAEAVALDPSIDSDRSVDEACNRLFLGATAREQNDNLRFVAKRILESEDPAGNLHLYGKVRRGESVPDDRTNPLVNVLLLSGIARVANTSLKVRNRIYSHAFDDVWITRNMPGQEAQRQREASRRGARTTAVVASLILLGIIAVGLTFKNRQLASLNRKLDAVATRAARAERDAKSAAAEAIHEKGKAEAENQRALLLEKQATAAHIREANLQTAVRLSAAEKTAREAALRALDARVMELEAEQSAATATTLRLAAESELLLDQSPSAIETSALMALAAIENSWTAETYAPAEKALALLPRHEHHIAWHAPVPEQVQSSRNGSVLVGESEASHQVCIWNLAALNDTCGPASVPQTSGYLVSDDGRWVVAKRSKSILYWDTTGERTWHELKDTPDAWTYTFSPVGNYYAYVSGNREVVVKSFPEGKVVRTFLPKTRIATPTAQLRAVEFGSDGTSLLLYDPSNQSYPNQLYEIASGATLLQAGDSGSDALFPLVLGPGAYALFRPFEGKLLVSNAFADTPPSFHAPGVNSADRSVSVNAWLFANEPYMFSPSGLIFAAALPEGVRLWHIPTDAQVSFNQTPNAKALAFSPDSKTIALVSSDHSLVRLFDTRRYSEYARLTQHDVTHVAFVGNSKLVTVTSHGIDTWNIDTPREVWTSPAAPLPAGVVLFAPHGHTLAIAPGHRPPPPLNSGLVLTDLKSGKTTRQFLGGVDFNQVSFSADGSRFAVAGSDGKVRFCESNGAREYSWKNLPRGSQLAGITADGENVVLLRVDGSPEILNARAPGNSSYTLPKGAFAASVDGNDQITAVYPDAIRLYNMRGALQRSIPLPQRIDATAVTPDGHTVLLWSQGVSSKQPSWLWTADANKFTSLPWTFAHGAAPQLSNDGRVVAVPENPGAWSVYELPSRRHLLNLNSFRPPALAAGGLSIAGSSFDGISVFNLPSGHLLARLPPNMLSNPVGFSRDGKLIISSGNKLEYWSLDEQKTFASSFQTEAYVNVAKTDPTGSYLVAGFGGIVPFMVPQGTDLQLIDPLSLAAKSVNLSNTVTAAAFSPDGQYIAAGALDGSVKLIRYSSGRVRELPTQSLDVSCVSISPDNQLVAVASGQRITVWSEKTDTWKTDYPDRVNGVEFSPDGREIAVGLSDGSVRVLTSFNYSEERSFQLGEPVTAISYSPDSHLLAAHGKTKAAIWNSSGILTTWSSKSISGGAFSPSGNLYASFGAGPALTLCDTRGKANIQRSSNLASSDLTFNSGRFSPDGQYLLLGASNGVHIQKITAGLKSPIEEVGQLPAEASVQAIAISPDGKFLALSTTSGLQAISYWRPADLVAQTCDRLQRKTLGADELSKYKLNGSKNYCAPGSVATLYGSENPVAVRP